MVPCKQKKCLVNIEWEDGWREVRMDCWERVGRRGLLSLQKKCLCLFNPSSLGFSKGEKKGIVRSLLVRVKTVQECLNIQRTI